MTTEMIIGIASGYKWRDLEPFVISLRRSGYCGRCVLITGDGPEEAVERYGLYGCQDDTISLQEKLGQFSVETFNAGTFKEHPIVARFRMAAAIIEQYNPSSVMLLDTKDMVFQYDPFRWASRRGISSVLTVVDETNLYEQSEGNRRNALAAYGEDAFQTLAKYPVVNGGTIAGNADYVYDLALDIYELCRKDRRLERFVPTYKDMLPDQTALNLLIRGKYAYATYVASVPDGFVYNFNHGDAGTVARDGIVYRKSDGEPFAIFHQYFNVPTWWQWVRERYTENASFDNYSAL